jgi:Terpene cyclase DEP1
MKPRHLYLALCAAGFLVPNSLFAPWVAAYGLNPLQFTRDLFANGVSAFFGMDVVLSALALIIFVLIEGARLKLARRWMPIVATCVVGVSLGLPLFLYQRQAHLDSRAA